MREDDRCAGNWIRWAPVLTLKEASAELGLHVDTLRWQIHNGKLKAQKFGPLWVITRAELEKYRAQHMRHPSQPSES